ncbi:hypothetical protein CT3_18060 [Comamonas terrigena NBRC 13299]|nr:hypothetical protein CT3_18060 [Comamonas terrigena NBRC 13299]
MAPFLWGNALLGSIGLFLHQAQAGALTATWARSAFGLLGLTLWLLWRRQGGQLRLTRQTAPGVLAAGSLMVLAWVLFFAAIPATSTGMAVVLFHVQPLWLVLATGTLSALWQDQAHATRPAYLLGVALCLLGALCTAAVTLIAQGLQRHQPVTASTLAWWQCLLGTVLLWVWPLQHGWPASGTSWLWLAGLGLAHTALAYMLIYAGMARLPTSRVALLIEGCCWASAWMAGNGWAWASSPAPWSGPNGRPRASPYLQQGAWCGTPPHRFQRHPTRTQQKSGRYQLASAGLRLPWLAAMPRCTRAW